MPQQTESSKKNFAKMRLSCVPSNIKSAFPYMTKTQTAIATKLIGFIRLILEKW